MIAPTRSFEDWATSCVGLSADDLTELDLVAAFDLLVSRCEDARRHGAADPLRSISPKGAGGNSRRCTREMLQQLGYTRPRLRIVHRLMGGSPAGWPGLLRIFTQAREVTRWERDYVRRQVRAFRHSGPPDARADHSSAHTPCADTASRSDSRLGCLTSPSAP